MDVEIKRRILEFFASFLTNKLDVETKRKFLLKVLEFFAAMLILYVLIILTIWKNTILFILFLGDFCVKYNVKLIDNVT